MGEKAQEEIVRKLFTDAQDISFLANGEVSNVYIVDNTYTVRFPHSNRKRKALIYETEILKLLDKKLPLAIPQVENVTKDKNCIVMSYVDGSVLGNREISDFNDGEKKELARAFARFIIKLNEVLDREKVRELQKQIYPEFLPYDTYYQQMKELATTSKSTLAEKFSRYIRDVETVTHEAKSILIHGDLHAGNMLFKGHELYGILDFGDVGLATIYDELRAMYSIDEELVGLVAKELAEKFGIIDLATIRKYAVVHELSVLLRSNVSSQRAAIAHMLLKKWGQE